MERIKPSDLQEKKQEKPEEKASPPNNDYFAFTPARKFIHTGCSLLDCALGGGWVLGRIANVVGDKSVGKCAKDYYVLTSEGMLYSEDVVPEFTIGATPINWTMALDRETDVRATHFWKEQVELTHKIETRHGIELTATPDHQVKVMIASGELIMKPLHCIEKGDWVVVSQGCDLFPNREVSLSEFVPKSFTTKYERIKFPSTLTPEVAAWLGALIADGTTSSGALVISAEKPWKRQHIQWWSEALFAGAFKAEPDGFSYSSQVREFVECLYGTTLKGTTARYKKVPSTILRSPKPVQAAFLRTLLDFDGEITPSGGLCWGTASKRLAREVQMMLLNFGIFGLLHSGWNEEYKWTYYSVGIEGPRFNEYERLIGTCREGHKRASRKAVSDICSIPFGLQVIQDELQSVRRRWGWTRNGKLSNGQRLPGLQAFCRKGQSTSYAYFEEYLNSRTRLRKSSLITLAF